MRKETVSGVGLVSLEGQSYAKLGAIAAVGARLFAVLLVAAKVLVVNNLNSTTEAVCVLDGDRRLAESSFSDGEISNDVDI